MAVASPCVDQCCLDEADICLGCGRALDEISRWSLCDDIEKQQIVARAAQRSEHRLARQHTHQS